MDRFNYREGVLHGEDVDLNALAAQLGTPLFVYSLGTLAAHLQAKYYANFAMVCYLAQVEVLRPEKF